MLETNVIIYILSIIVLILLSAFFAASETGLTAASGAKIHKLKSNGEKRAKKILALRDNKDHLISTLLLGNNAVNILSSALATSVAISLYGNQGVVYATILMTFLVLIFGEIIPKTYALYHAEKVSLRVVPLVSFIMKLMSPLTKLIQLIANGIMIVFRIQKTSDDVLSASEEILGAIDMHHAEGGVEKEDRDMLASILDLERIEIKDIMIHRKHILSIDANLPIDEIVSLVIDNVHTRIPLWKGKPENVIGILHARALLAALRQHSGNVDELDILQIAAKPWFVPETNTIGNQLLQFREKKMHLALVVNEYGDLVGLVTLEDILEEIVGEIEDEHDNRHQHIRKLAKKGWYEVSGEVTVRDLNRELGWKMPDQFAATIAGYLIHELKYIPEQGEEGKISGFYYKILKKNNNHISRVHLKRVVKKNS